MCGWPAGASRAGWARGGAKPAQWPAADATSAAAAAARASHVGGGMLDLPTRWVATSLYLPHGSAECGRRRAGKRSAQDRPPARLQDDSLDSVWSPGMHAAALCPHSPLPCVRTRRVAGRADARRADKAGGAFVRADTPRRPRTRRRTAWWARRAQVQGAGCTRFAV